MITPSDELPIHQAAVPLASNPLGLNAYDRYFFNGYNHDGSVFFAVALGVYPNRGVVDTALSVVVDGKQSSLFASRRLGADVTNLSVGPIEVCVDDPLSQITITSSDERLQADLRFDATSAPIEEPRFTNANSGLGAFDYTRFTQFGSWTGSVTVDGVPTNIDGLSGCRDRSWGQRPVGGPSGAAPASPQFFWLWAPLSFPSGALHFDVNDYADGSRWHDAGFKAPPLVAGVEPWMQAVEPMKSVDYEVTLEPGTRWVRDATLTLRPWNSAELEVSLRPLSRFQMKGLGYGHPSRRHGAWQGELSVEFEQFEVSEVDPTDPTNFHVQHLVEAKVGDEVGVGVLEILALGPHVPTGLTGVTDVSC